MAASQDLPQFQRIGPIVHIIRVLKTRWDDMPTATFASIDGEHFYGVNEHARLGDELEVVAEGRAFRPMSMTAEFVRHLALAPNLVLEERPGAPQVIVRHTR